jgi:hypothetical protein
MLYHVDLRGIASVADGTVALLAVSSNLHTSFNFLFRGNMFINFPRVVFQTLPHDGIVMSLTHTFLLSLLHPNLLRVRSEKLRLCT